MKKIPVAKWNELESKVPAYALVSNVDLVVVRYTSDGQDQVSVLYGRCLHRGALMSDGCVNGHNLVCGVHGWDYRVDTGVSEYNNAEVLIKFNAWIEIHDGEMCVLVDEDQITAWHAKNPQPYNRNEYLGLYADTHSTDEEPHVNLIQEIAKHGRPDQLETRNRRSIRRPLRRPCKGKNLSH